MILAALFLAQVAAATPPTVTGFGMGGYSCARAFEPHNFAITQSWVLGFWSGVNNTRGLQVGRNTDAAGVVGEVRRVCEDQPATLLYVAVDQAYANLHAKGL